MAMGKASKARAATNVAITAAVPAEQLQTAQVQARETQVQETVTPLPFPVSVAGGSITAVAPTPGPPSNVSELEGMAAYAERSIAHIDSEVAALEAKSKGIQEEMQTKTKELATLKETLLVVSGALQGLGHMRQYFDGERRSGTDDPPGAPVGDFNK